MGASSSRASAPAAPLTPADAEAWQQQQGKAIQLRDRLELSLSRMSREDASHALLRNLLEQLQRLADLSPGSVSLQHFTTLVSNCAATLGGSHSALVRGATAAEINRLPTRSATQRDAAAANEGGRCSVCLSAWVPGRDVIRTLPCFHYFHTRCIDPWLSTHGCCPSCRTPLPP